MSEFNCDLVENITLFIKGIENTNEAYSDMFFAARSMDQGQFFDGRRSAAYEIRRYLEEFMELKQKHEQNNDSSEPTIPKEKEQ